MISNQTKKIRPKDRRVAIFMVKTNALYTISLFLNYSDLVTIKK